ncbi:hypothetical protein [Umezawaea sp. NPDC059074]|uniref:hypothetical protein n=1 Tax=Umezawaea sp. NPDC059074 TaxID=3346716 RepID=UPI00369C62AA
MNTTTRTADALADDLDLVIYEFDRPSGHALDFLGFSVHTEGGPIPGVRSALAG